MEVLSLHRIFAAPRVQNSTFSSSFTSATVFRVAQLACRFLVRTFVWHHGLL